MIIWPGPSVGLLQVTLTLPASFNATTDTLALLGGGESDGKHSEVEIAKWALHGFAIIDLNNIVCAILHKHSEVQIAHMMNVKDTDNKALNEMR